MMNFESLANETLLDIFTYLPSEDLFYSFRDINNRFDRLLIENFRTRGVDLVFLSRKDSYNLFDTYLQPIINENLSICLGNTDLSRINNKTVICGRLDLLKLKRLHALKLDHLPLSILPDFVKDICSFQYLQTLKISLDGKHFTFDNFDLLIDGIWSSKSLENISLHVDRKSFEEFPSPMTLSSSIKTVSITGFCCTFEYFSHILLLTPNLQSFEIALLGYYNQVILEFPKTPIKKLHVTLHEMIHITYDFYACMSELTELIVETQEVTMDGYYWEQVIIGNFPNLKRFKYVMDKRNNNFDQWTQARLDLLMTSFQTNFWSDQLKCSFQCDSYMEARLLRFIFYSIPFPLKDYKFLLGSTGLISTRTSIDIDYSKSHRKVRTFTYKYARMSQKHSSPLVFEFVENLNINIACDSIILSLVPKFDRLTCLAITISESFDDLQLRTLLEKAVRLRQIVLQFNNLERFCLNDVVVSPTLRQVEFINDKISNIFSTGVIQFWDRFAATTLGQQCQSLIFSPGRSFDIVPIIHRLKKLTKITFRSKQGHLSYNNQMPLAQSVSSDSKLPIGWTLNDDTSNPNIIFNFLL